jgi:uncharacterized protein DUF1707
MDGTPSYDPQLMSNPLPPSRPSAGSGETPSELAAAGTAGSVTPHESALLRASDAEREHAVLLLRNAVSEGRLSVEELEERLQSAYTVRTRRELELLVADVSAHSIDDGRRIVPPLLGGPVGVRQGPGGTRWVVSIMSGDDRRGRWRIARRCTVINVMGGSDLDLCDVELSHPVTRLNVYSIMGGGQIRVPNGVDVQVSKLALMGGNDVRLGDNVPPPGGPVIRIRLVSIMGGCSVRRGRKLSRAERQRERELRKSERRNELDP